MNARPVLFHVACTLRDQETRSVRLKEEAAKNPERQLQVVAEYLGTLRHNEVPRVFEALQALDSELADNPDAQEALRGAWAWEADEMAHRHGAAALAEYLELG